MPRPYSRGRVALHLIDCQVTIVGLGLMGGSLAAALMRRGACRRVVGVARRSSTLTTALALRFIQQGSTDLAEGVAGADVVILATPVGEIIETLGRIGPLLKPDCVLLDIGSTKSAICQAMQVLPGHIQPVGGHPMCGKETSGLTMAEPDLYQGRAFVLTPLERTAPWALTLAQELVVAIGARPLLLAPERHDALVAAISHLPYLLAATLVNAADHLAQGDPTLWQLAAGGFRDTSRVAASNLDMMLDILRTNRLPVLEALARAQQELATLADLLRAEDWPALEARLTTAHDRRTEVFP